MNTVGELEWPSAQPLPYRGPGERASPTASSRGWSYERRFGYLHRLASDAEHVSQRAKTAPVLEKQKPAGVKLPVRLVFL
jgi:hypothetical protein